MDEGGRRKCYKALVQRTPSSGTRNIIKRTYFYTYVYSGEKNVF